MEVYSRVWNIGSRVDSSWIKAVSMTCPDLVYEVILVVLWFERRVKRVFMRETSWKYIRSGGNCALGRYDDGLPN